MSAEQLVKARRVFIESTNSDHDHGGKGWEFGVMLWSPARSVSGANIYNLMEKMDTNDLVLHFLDQDFVATSRVAAPLKKLATEPPEAGKWSGQGEYYQVRVKDFELLPAPVPIRKILDDFAEEIEAELSTPMPPPKYPFHIGKKNGKLGRNEAYVFEVTPVLYSVFERVVALPAGSPSGDEAVEEYSEAKRRARERYYFARNPKLVADAKAKYGYTCQICEFDFAETYGPVGDQYIECHHLNPLSERPETEQLGETKTQLDEVIVVCSNCHRMLHRKRPALEPKALREMMGL